MADDDLTKKLAMLNSIPVSTKEPELNKLFPALIIGDISNRVSVVGMRNVIDSITETKSNLTPIIIPATTPETLDRDLKYYDMTVKKWNYPAPGKVKNDLRTGLKLTGYLARDERKVIACAVSHYRCWQLLTVLGGGVVFEHDAIVKKKISPGKFQFPHYGIIGLNDPRGATRKSMLYHERTIDSKHVSPVTLEGEEGDKFTITEAPWVDDDRTVPQGLAGNSAYFISQARARTMVNLVETYGLWPNDALMCKQLVSCKQIFPYMTGLQRIQSTTTG